MIRCAHTLLTLLLGFCFTLNAQLPNGGMEFWDEGPVLRNWKTNSRPQTLPPWEPYIVRQDSQAYSGKLAAGLYANGMFRAEAKTEFRLYTHPKQLHFWHKLHFAPCVNDSNFHEKDTVRVLVEILFEGKVVDAGLWESSKETSEYTHTSIPVSKQSTQFDSCRVSIFGGSVYGGCGFVAEGTYFLVDEMAISYSDKPGCIDPEIACTDCACPEYYDPVCGCDGISYGNPCEALREGVSSWTLGVCRDTTFTCIDSTKICSDCPCYALYKPVCGCDGITYENDCFAKNAGLLKWSDGACEGVRNCDPHFYYWYDSFNENFHFSSTSFQTDSLIYSWTFGDGISSTGPYSSHDFADTTIGAWKVCLEVSHLDGTCSEQFCDSVYTSIRHDPCHAGFGFTVQGTQDAITFLSGQASNPQNQRSWIVGDTIYENTDTLLVNIATLADEVICQVLHNDSTGCNDTVCISGKEVRFSLMALPTGKVLQSEKRISTVFPNPIHAGSTISIHGLETNKHYTFTFFDSKGAEVSKPGSVSGSDLGAQIIAPGAGMYFLEIKDTSVLYRSVTPVIVLP